MAPLPAPLQPNGRGARSNATGRYESLAREAFDDGWTELDEPPRKLRTVLHLERAKKIITTNDSPDIGFDQSINPYRGCEHGWERQRLHNQPRVGPLLGEHPAEQAMTQVQEADDRKEDSHRRAKPTPEPQEWNALRLPQPWRGHSEPSDTQSECEKSRTCENHKIRHPQCHSQAERFLGKQAWHFSNGSEA